MGSSLLFLIAAVSTIAVSGTDLKLTWSDCGDAQTHGKVSTLTPGSLTLGQTSTVTGAGTVDEGVSGGNYVLTLKALGVTLVNHKGDLCKADSVKLPLGTGTIAWKGLACPISAGAVSVSMDVTLSGSLPSQLDKTTISLTGTSSTGDKLLCVSLQTSKESAVAVVHGSFDPIVSVVNSLGSSWVAAAPDRFASVEDVKPYLGAYLPGHPKHKSPPVKEITANVVLPDSFDARTQWPACGGIATVRDQSACGSCWAFGSVDSFQDRACVATGRDVRYSAEDTAFCSNAGNGCSGGNTAWNWFQEEGVVTGGKYDDIGKGDTCLPYSLAPCAHHVPATSKYKKCPAGEYPSPRCKAACSESAYNKTYRADKVRASDSYSVRGVSQIQTELMNKGPLYVAFTVYGDFPTYKSGVYQHKTGGVLGGHAVELIGWGSESGTDYWLVKNSWNEQWGANGLFKILRGHNECGIESDVSGGTIGDEVSPDAVAAVVV